MKDLKQIVEGLDDQSGRKVDPLIKDLIIGLMKMGIKTISSCEGHEGLLSSKYGSFPWVFIEFKGGVAEKLTKLTAWYNMEVQRGNTTHKIEWIVHPRNVLILKPEVPNLSLEKTQKSAREFGKKLQDLSKMPDFKDLDFEI